MKSEKGYYVSKAHNLKDKIVAKEIYLGIHDSISNYDEVTEEEGLMLIQQKEAAENINTIEDIDKTIIMNSVITNVINDISMTNKEAVAHVSSFPKWESFINKNLDEVGFRINYNNKLYEILQPVSPVLEHQTPDLVPANYGLVSEHEGTKKDPIPYERMMVIRKDKYYTQNGKLYIGILDAPNGYDADLETLSTLVKEVKE